MNTGDNVAPPHNVLPPNPPKWLWWKLKTTYSQCYLSFRCLPSSQRYPRERWNGSRMAERKRRPTAHTVYASSNPPSSLVASVWQSGEPSRIWRSMIRNYRA